MISHTKLNRNIGERDWLLSEINQSQARANITLKAADTITFAFIGAIGGALLSAVGSLISSTPLGVIAAVTIGIAIGAYAGRLTGGIIGAIYGVLAAACGSLVGGTALGVTVTILACACLAAWCTWSQRDVPATRVPHRNFDRAERLRAETRGEKMTEIHS